MASRSFFRREERPGCSGAPVALSSRTRPGARLEREGDGKDDGLGRSLVAFSPCGDVLATAGDAGIRLWSVRDGTLVRKLRGERRRWFGGLAFTPSGDRLIASGYGVYVFKVDRLPAPPASSTAAPTPGLVGSVPAGRGGP